MIRVSQNKRTLILSRADTSCMLHTVISMICHRLYNSHKRHRYYNQLGLFCDILVDIKVMLRFWGIVLVFFMELLYVVLFYDIVYS